MKVTKKQLKRIIRKTILEEAADPKAEMNYGWLSELVYDEMNIVGAIRGFANRSRLAGRFYDELIPIAEAKGDMVLAELLKAARASSMGFDS